MIFADSSDRSLAWRQSTDERWDVPTIKLLRLGWTAEIQVQYMYLSVRCPRYHKCHRVRPRLHETGTNSDCSQSEDFREYLHETRMKLKPCSCKYFWPHFEFSLIPSNNAYLIRRINGWSEEISRFHEDNFVPVRVRTGLNSFVSVQHPKWAIPVRAELIFRTGVM